MLHKLRLLFTVADDELSPERQEALFRDQVWAERFHVNEQRNVGRLAAYEANKVLGVDRSEAPSLVDRALERRLAPRPAPGKWLHAPLRDRVIAYVPFQKVRMAP